MPASDMTRRPAIHPTASSGYTLTADSYLRGRPDYPAGIGVWLRDTVGLGPGTTVVDLGAGTGKFTPRLLASGADVIAIEPVAPMLQILSRMLPQVQAMPGSATAIPLPDASVDAVICAQAFHWFANTAALTEIHRILKPGGKLGLIWNQRDSNVDWVAKLDHIVNRYEDNTPRYYTGAWRNAFPHPGFGPLHEQHFGHGHTGNPEDVIVNRVRSTSFIAAMSAAQQAVVEADVRALIAAHPVLAGRQEITVPYETNAFCMMKRLTVRPPPDRDTV